MLRTTTHAVSIVNKQFNLLKEQGLELLDTQVFMASGGRLCLLYTTEPGSCILFIRINM